MNLNVIGLNHKTAPLELREKFVFQTDLLTEALVEIKKLFQQKWLSYRLAIERKFISPRDKPAKSYNGSLITIKFP